MRLYQHSSGYTRWHYRDGVTRKGKLRLPGAQNPDIWAGTLQRAASRKRLPELLLLLRLQTEPYHLPEFRSGKDQSKARWRMYCVPQSCKTIQDHTACALLRRPGYMYSKQSPLWRCRKAQPICALFYEAKPALYASGGENICHTERRWKQAAGDHNYTQPKRWPSADNLPSHVATSPDPNITERKQSMAKTLRGNGILSMSPTLHAHSASPIRTIPFLLYAAP